MLAWQAAQLWHCLMSGTSRTHACDRNRTACSISENTGGLFESSAAPPLATVPKAGMHLKQGENGVNTVDIHFAQASYSGASLRILPAKQGEFKPQTISSS